MEEFKGLARGFTRSKQPPNTWEFAKNILLDKGFKSVCNEDGFDNTTDIPGIIIGTIVSSEYKIYFSILDELSCIGYTTFEDDYTNYIPVLQSQYLKFKSDRPIEGIFFINYKGELIISFCDGVFEDSNTPKLINLFNIGIPLTGLELTNPEDLSKLQLFSESLEGMIVTNYEEAGTLEADVVYITFCYVFSDSISSTSYFPIHILTYPTINFRNMDKRNIVLNLTELDTRFSQIKIGLIINTDNGLIGYESNNLSFNETTYNTIISSLSNFNEITIDSLIVPSIIYTRIKTMTTHNSEIDIGNLVGSEIIKFQKYANMLKLDLAYDIREENKYTLPTLCPDEVYAFYISLHQLNNTYTERFHIPLLDLIDSTNLDDLTSSDFIDLGLSGVDSGISYKRFHLINTGNFKILSTPVDLNNPDELELDWGYWQNEELYPNDDNYNSTIDYEGNALAGLDLRNTSIKYHRIPGLDALTSKFPSLLGYNDRNTEDSINPPSGNFYGLIPAFSVTVNNFMDIVPASILEKIQGFELSIVKRKRGDTLVEDINFLKQCFKVKLNTVDGKKIFSVTPDSKEYIEEDEDIAYNVAQFGVSKIRSNTLSIYKPSIGTRIVKANYAVHEAISGTRTLVENPYTADFSKPETRGGLGTANRGLIITDIDALPSHIIFVNNKQQFAEIKRIKYIKSNNEPEQSLFIEEYIELNANNTNVLPNTVGAPIILDTRWNPLNLQNTDSTSSSETLSGLYWNYITRKYESITLGDTRGGGNSQLIEEECFKYAICSTFLNLTKNIYQGFKPTEFITIGRNTLVSAMESFREGGDVFESNIINIDRAKAQGPIVFSALVFDKLAIKGNFAITNNSEIYMGEDKDYYEPYGTSIGIGGRDYSDLLGYSYDYKIFNKEQLRSLNDLLVSLAFDYRIPYINYFPYRVHRSLKLGNETLKTNNLRTFLANKYKEMLSNRGEIIALRGTNRNLYISQRFSLFLVGIKDKLDSSSDTTFVGESDIFDRLPDEILESDNKGYIGCSSQFACIIYRDGLVIEDQIKGKIYVVNDKADEISKDNMSNWFNENWQTPLPTNGYFTLNRFSKKQNIDNPFTQIGHLVGFDYKYNRLLFTKKVFKPLFVYGEDLDFIFDGSWFYQVDIIDDITTYIKLDYYNSFYFKEISETFSYSIDNKCWVCEHSYFPSVYIDNEKGLYSIYNKNNQDAAEWRHNDLYSKVFPDTLNSISFIDFIFNSRFDLKKLYQEVSWITEVIRLNYDNSDLRRDYFKTIDIIQLYNDYQATQEINLNTGFISIVRNTENEWQFNNFRDIVINNTLPLVNDEGVIDNNNLNINKSWFEKSNFISNFIVVRMIIHGQDTETTYIHCVNVKSRTSDR